MLKMADRLPVGSVAFVVETDTLYVRVRHGFRPATVSEYATSWRPGPVVASFVASVHILLLLFVRISHYEITEAVK